MWVVVKKKRDTVSGTPTYDGTSETTYSCVSGVHSQYEVHVISNYESDGQHGFGHTHITGTTYRCKCEC